MNAYRVIQIIKLRLFMFQKLNALNKDVAIIIMMKSQRAQLMMSNIKNMINSRKRDYQKKMRLLGGVFEMIGDLMLSKMQSTNSKERRFQSYDMLQISIPILLVKQSQIHTRMHLDSDNCFGCPDNFLMKRSILDQDGRSIEVSFSNYLPLYQFYLQFHLF
ncbi:unnamed protein product [Paramecium primaurelia]|uniref:Uncharacterized protein n=1 Tax=Paramecium primaurelia TaxID=5886 RepID=A0A8S1P2D8_PARPR|nr:unnamed protein product [Paramecium primaurelia]CAD8095704.1 unnamed protein product [Paramecium primaurelia]